MPFICGTNEAQTEKETPVGSDLQPLGLYPSRCELLPSSEWLRQFWAAFWSLWTRPGQPPLDCHSKFTRSTSLSPFPGEETDTREVSAGGQDYLGCHVTCSNQSKLTRTSVGQTQKKTLILLGLFRERGCLRVKPTQKKWNLGKGRNSENAGGCGLLV